MISLPHSRRKIDVLDEENVSEVSKTIWRMAEKEGAEKLE